MISSAVQIFDDSVPFIEKLRFVYRFQLRNNPVYKTFASHFEAHNIELPGPDEVPLLPVRAFKDTKLTAGDKPAEIIFKSSGTGQMSRSEHHILDAGLYKTAIETEFRKHFDPDNSVILCYTPGYNENPDSSLLWMLDHLIKITGDKRSRFLPAGKSLSENEFREIEYSGIQLFLFGAAFGLVDLAEQKKYRLPQNSVIIETGGMKTLRREIQKPELRKIISDGFGVTLKSVHSEYGMCEMLSQCYAIGSEWFTAPNWVRVTVRDAMNPSRICKPGEEGKIGVIDLANIHSCPFILTDDRGVTDTNGRFKVLGRWHKAEMRGCNFLIDRD